MDIETRLDRWTCYICHNRAPVHSLASLEAQEKSKETEIYIDGDYRVYLRCPACDSCFHASCAAYEIELFLIRELTGTLCERCACAKKQDVTRNGVTTKILCTQEVANMLMSKEIDSEVKEMIVNQLLSTSTLPSAGETPPLPGPSVPPPRSSSTPPPCSSSAPPLLGPSAPPLPGPSAPPPRSSSAPPLPGPSAPPFPGPSAPPLPGPAVPPLPGPSSVQDEDTNGKWDVQSIKLLKKVYHDIESQSSSKPLKNKWQKVAKEVNKEGGYNFSAEKRRLKIKGSNRNMNVIRKKNNTSGESPASDEDEDDFEKNTGYET